MTRRLSFPFTFALLAGLVLVGAARPQGDADLPTIERAMVARGRKLAEAMHKRGYANVGVLKFLVSTDGKTMSDTVGTLNMRLAKQLELALLLRNTPMKPLGVIKNASAVAHRTTGASHRTRDGRTKLFEASYPLYWGNKEVKADAFLTGLAEISKDLQTLTVRMLLVEGKENRVVHLKEFDLKAKMDASKLSEAGESFVLRGAFDDGRTETAAREEKREKAAVAAAVKSRENPTQHPYFNGSTPVTLKVLYDGRPASIVFRNGKAFIPTPGLGQKVVFVLTRDGGKETYGAVLKVNGENTVGKQKLPDLECRRWILNSGSRSVTVSGFQRDDNKAEEFRVASREESARLAVHYGEDSGTISLTVFRARTGEAPTPDPLDRDAPRVLLVKKAVLPDTKAETFGSLLAALENDTSRGVGDGGLIVAGKEIASKVKVVKFTPDPVPVMSLSITYYKP